jgi:hypothetical protein
VSGLQNECDEREVIKKDYSSSRVDLLMDE